ncbi:hypothetical protein [Frondihabitans peucedani]
MSESPRDELSRHEREEQEVRDALLGDASERNTAWLFEQLGDAGAGLMTERDARD